MKIKQDNAFLVMARRVGIREPFTICDLFWRSLLGTAITACGYFIGAMLLAVTVGPWLLSLVYFLNTGNWYFSDTMWPLLSFIGGVAVISGVFYFSDYVVEQDPFAVLREAYKARNEKFCSYVEVEYK